MLFCTVIDKLNVVISILQQLLSFLCPYTLHCWVCSCSSMELPQVLWKMVSANKFIIGLIHSRERVTRYAPIIMTLPRIRHLHTSSACSALSLSTYQSTISVTVHSCVCMMYMYMYNYVYTHDEILHLQCVAKAMYPFSIQVSMLC